MVTNVTMSKSKPTQQRLIELFDYNPETGVFTRRRTGTIVGTRRSDGYINIEIGKQSFYAHILAWIDPSNNRISNLRLAEPSQNAANRKRYKSNTSGFKGVCLHRKAGRYVAKIVINGESIYLGLHDTPEQAATAYRKAADGALGEFARMA